MSSFALLSVLSANPAGGTQVQPEPVQAPPTALLTWPKSIYKYSSFTLRLCMTPYSTPAPAVQPLELIVRVLLLINWFVVLGGGHFALCELLDGRRLRLDARLHAGDGCEGEPA